jgi:hypothetical protein
VALYLTESGKTLVHVPERQPTDTAACNNVVRAAIDFAETVGFFMDVLPLGSTPAERAGALDGVPVLARDESR